MATTIVSIHCACEGDSAGSIPITDQSLSKGLFYPRTDGTNSQYPTSSEPEFFNWGFVVLFKKKRLQGVELHADSDSAGKQFASWLRHSARRRNQSHYVDLLVGLLKPSGWRLYGWNLCLHRDQTLRTFAANPTQH